MSIWCSWTVIGHDGFDEPRGDVRAYLQGKSNHFPDGKDPKAAVDVAHVAPHCVPGHFDDFTDWPQVGPWLRLSLYRDEQHSVVMDETAVRALRDDLNLWLECPKVHPVSPPP